MEREMYRFENASFHLRIDSFREAGVGDLVTDTPPGWPPPPTLVVSRDRDTRKRVVVLIRTDFKYRNDR